MPGTELKEAIFCRYGATVLDAERGSHISKGFETSTSASSSHQYSAVDGAASADNFDDEEDKERPKSFDGEREMAAVSAPHAPSNLTPPSSSHGGQNWNYSVPAQSEVSFRVHINSMHIAAKYFSAEYPA